MCTDTTSIKDVSEKEQKKLEPIQEDLNKALDKIYKNEIVPFGKQLYNSDIGITRASFIFSKKQEIVDIFKKYNLPNITLELVLDPYQGQIVNLCYKGKDIETPRYGATILELLQECEKQDTNNPNMDKYKNKREMSKMEKNFMVEGLSQENEEIMEKLMGDFDTAHQNSDVEAYAKNREDVKEFIAKLKNEGVDQDKINEVINDFGYPEL